MSPVYLDCNASTPMDPRVLRAYVQQLQRSGNANSRVHTHGRCAHLAAEEARAHIAALFGATAAELVPTSGATESIDLALLGTLGACSPAERPHLVTTAIEHAATLASAERLARRGVEVAVVGCSTDGIVDADELLGAVRDDTRLVSVIHVNNETGAIQPIGAIADGLEDHDAVLHVDAAQGFGKLQAPLRHPRIDLISLSGHKLHAPVGIGGLLVRERVADRVVARRAGGPSLDPRRPGTPTTALLVAMATAASLAVEEADTRWRAWEAYRAEAASALQRLGARVNTPLDQAIPNVLSVELPGHDAEVVMMQLGDLVSISNGSACHSGGTPSHVLRAMGRSPRQIQSTLRWSWCHLTPPAPRAQIVERLQPGQRATG